MRTLTASRPTPIPLPERPTVVPPLIQVERPHRRRVRTSPHAIPRANPRLNRGGHPARVVIADDHAVMRAGLRNLLHGERTLQIVGEAANGQEALDLCRELLPDLALLDLRMPVMDGLEATRAIKSSLPSVAVILLTMFADPSAFESALHAGAAACMLKDAARAELLSAIHRALLG